jgi:phage-related minor tail protein
LTAIVEAGLLRQVEAVKARYQQEQAALETSRQSEAALIARSTQLLTEALTQQATLRRTATVLGGIAHDRSASLRRGGLTVSNRTSSRPAAAGPVGWLYTVESRCGAVALGSVCLLPPLSSGGARVTSP